MTHNKNNGEIWASLVYRIILAALLTLELIIYLVLVCVNAKNLKLLAGKNSKKTINKNEKYKVYFIFNLICLFFIVPQRPDWVLGSFLKLNQTGDFFSKSKEIKRTVLKRLKFCF